MKKLISIILCGTLIFTMCACGGKSPEKEVTQSPQAESTAPQADASTDSAAAQSQPVEIDEGLLEVRITVPADFLEEGKTQADYDAAAKESGYKSATLNSDGSVTYVMTKRQHKELLKKIGETIESSTSEMVGSADYPNFVSIDHNDDFSVFTVVSKSKDLSFNESFSVLIFYMFSAMYNSFAGIENGNCRIDFVDEATGQVFDSADSSGLGNSASDLGQSEDGLPGENLPKGDYTEKGPGKVYVSTPSGTSENGNIPVLYADPYSWLIQIGLEAWDFNGGALSFIYIDGLLNTKEQLSNTQTSLSLSGDALSVGIHTVEVVQYENDDPAAAMTVYKSMQYEVKAK